MSEGLREGREAVGLPRGGGDHARVAGGWKEKLVAYKDLAKIDISEDYFNFVIGWTLLTGAVASQGRSVSILLLMLVMQVGVVTAACALDDVSGIRDGIDTFNYAQSGVGRKRSRKPLLDGRLSEREALWYAGGAVTIGVAALVGAYAVADFQPWWIPLAFVTLGFGVVCYSWGPKLSYIGGQELVVVLGYTGVIAATYAMITRHLTATPVLEGALLGVWLMQLTAFANVHDREGDARASRVTMAVRLSSGGNDRYLLALFGVGWAILAAGLATGELPWQLALTQIPCIVLQLVALRDGLVRGQHLRARAVGLWVLRVGLLSLLVANLLAFH